MADNSVPDDDEDEKLLAELRAAFRAQGEVPEWFTETGRNAFAWRNIDAELAQLTHDSRDEAGQATAVRSEAASIRSLTFTSAGLSIELTVTGTALAGQIAPPRAGMLEVHTAAGVISAPIDETGGCTVDPIPAGPFRLRCRTGDGADVLTGWITL